MTVGSFLKWKQEDLLPRPLVRSLGRGRGSASGWPWQAYRQLLRLLIYRHRRFRRWRDLRIALWLDGYDINLGQIREDLHDLYRQIVASSNRELRTEMWQASEDSPPSDSAKKAIKRRLTGADVLEVAVRHLELDPVSEPLVRLGMSALLTPEGQRLAVAFVHQFFASGPGDIPPAIAAFRAILPTPISDFLEGAENDFARHAGILAHPEGFKNPMLIGIQEASDLTLVNMRDVANDSNRVWVSVLQLAAVALQLRPELIGPFRLMAPILVQMAESMRPRSPFQSPEARVVVIALALANPSVRASEAVKLTLGLRSIAALAEWLTLHPELIRELDLSDERWNALAKAPDFPSEVKVLIHGASH